MGNFLSQIPAELINLVLVIVFSLTLGLEQRKRFHESESKETFGTDRTFTFIGIFGFMLLSADNVDKIPYLIGYCLVGILLTVFYYFRVQKLGIFGFTSIVLALITYGFPLLIETTPRWLALLIFVIVLVFTELKKSLGEISEKIQIQEFITVGKFIIIAGVILPLLPDKVINAEFIPVSSYKIWLAVVVVSTISYLSYLLRKYVFPEAGLLLTGILGGLYSSTASTVILARKSKTDDTNPNAYAGAIIVATAMMFLRIFMLILIFNQSVAVIAYPYFIALFLISLGVGFWLYRMGNKENEGRKQTIMEDSNPLEFKIALLFAFLYVVFSAATQQVLVNFGTSGLSFLSYVVGFTDIDPFLLNLFQGHYNVEALLITIATLQAAGSNNVLKAGYAAFLGGKNTRKRVLFGFGIVLVFNVLAVVLLNVI